MTGRKPLDVPTFEADGKLRGEFPASGHDLPNNSNTHIPMSVFGGKRQVFHTAALTKPSKIHHNMSCKGEKRQVNPSEFIRNHPVFRREEFVSACYPGAPPGSRAAERALAHHRSTGRLIRVRRGLYAVKSPRSSVTSFQIAAKLAPDAVLGYHSALEYLGIAYSLWTDRLILTATKVKGFFHDGVEYRPISFPAPLDTPGKRGFGVETRDDGGIAVRVTSLERTLVDLLDRPEYSGGWEELWRSYANAGFLDTRVVLEHTRHLANRTTAARVGWFLEQHREQWLVPDSVLARLETMVPATPVYLIRSRREGGKLHSRWNLIVPARVRGHAWEEVP